MSTKAPTSEPDLPGAEDLESRKPEHEPEGHADEAKGTPHTDRHAAETVAGRLDHEGPAETKTK